jgi:hypothetical protein
MSDGVEVERLQDLLEACHRVLPGIEGRNDDLAQAIRATCEGVEARLRELGVDVEADVA